jgi:hypothetical protein
MPPSTPPSPPARPREPGSLVSRFGTTVGVAAAAALACAFPATLRVSRALGGVESTAHVWLALASAVLVPMIAAVFVLRRAREGWRAFGGPGASAFVYGVSLWLAALVVGLSVLASQLRATTHHHALAGVTFAVGGLVLALGAGVVCARIVSVLKAMSAPARRGAALVLAAAVGAALLWVAVGSTRAASQDAASAAEAGMVVDDLAFLLAAAFAARHAFVVRRVLALVGPPLAVVVLAVGVRALHGAPLRDAVHERALAFAAAAEVLAPRP